MKKISKVVEVKYRKGFTYIGLLIFVAIMGVILSGAASFWSLGQQRERERELLFVGHQFRRAIALYYERTPGAVKKYPASLEDLLQDKRYVTHQHYLRQIYRDPVGRSNNWGLVYASGGGVMGVYSKSDATPIKTKRFKYEDKMFESAKKYSDWKFVYSPL